MGKHHKLYSVFKEAYASSDDKKFKNFKYSLDLDTSLSSGIAGKIWRDDCAVLEGETYRSPISYVCPDVNNNHVLSMRFHDPVYESEYVFKANILEGAM